MRSRKAYIPCPVHLKYLAALNRITLTGVLQLPLPLTINSLTPTTCCLSPAIALAPAYRLRLVPALMTILQLVQLESN